ncbi:class I SAM-dependent methyltransferase family protein [Candidatus Micrarchaeota archaeon]|nr:class I SAM-dependent methyltransferase family protein [Candidatus Micrarchaeota archaeon]
MRFLKILKNQGEQVRQELIASNLLSNDYPIIAEGQFILIPVKSHYKDYAVVEMDAEKRPPQYATLKESLKDILTEEQLNDLVTSFDIIGDIAIVEIPESLKSEENQIGKALLKVHKNVNCVFKKLSAMEGEYRIRKLSHIAGENRTETTYREHGIDMKLDVSKAYFSVRLSHERGRIADLVKPREKILVLFAGVGPFALVIAKKHPDCRITAVELNPEAVRYMKENIALNRFNIEAIEGDAKQFAGTGYDRIIMPLPHSAHEFLDVAIKAAKPRATIHYYAIVGSEDPVENAMQKIPPGLKLVSSKIARPYSADLVQVVLDMIKS